MRFFLVRFSKKISLGLKQTIDDPWNNIDDIFQVDLKLKGKVLYILDKGIIFLLDNDFEGILPISKIDDKDKEIFIINKEFDLSVNQINQENRKIVLDYTIESKDDDIDSEDNDTDSNDDIKSDDNNTLDQSENTIDDKDSSE